MTPLQSHRQWAIQNAPYSTTTMMLKNWLKYILEAFGLGGFMISAGLFATLLYAPESPVFHLLPEWLRGLSMGIAMGVAAIAIIYSPGGKHSGAHINPAVTLTFYRLHKIQARDAVAYIVAQFIGGLVTVPGLGGEFLAFVIEFLLSFGLMLMILFTSNTKAFSNLTGIFAGILLSFYIPFAAPISGMSINPARTFASALPAQMWMGLWLYFVAPLMAMLLAAQVFLWFSQRTTRELCCKLCPNSETPCISHRCCRIEVNHSLNTDL